MLLNELLKVFLLLIAYGYMSTIDHTEAASRLRNPTRGKMIRKLKSAINGSLPTLHANVTRGSRKKTSRKPEPLGLVGYRTISNVKTQCQPTPVDSLLSRLGTAFNFRFMSVDRPVERRSSKELGKLAGYQQDHDFFTTTEPPDFYVDGNFIEELEDNGMLHQSQTSKFIARIKRSAKRGGNKNGHVRAPSNNNNKLPWQCPARLIWRDLGSNHFPQYLRSVRCLSKRCWFAHFRCRAKSFTTKVLKRKSDSCVPVPLSNSSNTHYEQLWVFEERAVTFCCECVDT